MRVLILEDDPFISMDLQGILEEEGHQVVGTFASVDAARPHVNRGLDYALLDIDVAGGKSFTIAEELQDLCIPFAFVSASPRSDIPAAFQVVNFISKPYDEKAILRSVGAGHRMLPQ